MAVAHSFPIHWPVYTAPGTLAVSPNRIQSKDVPAFAVVRMAVASACWEGSAVVRALMAMRAAAGPHQ